MANSLVGDKIITPVPKDKIKKSLKQLLKNYNRRDSK